jgi:site-specific DNA-methyltransferase (adenine-specific)
MGPEEYLSWCSSWIREGIRVLAQGGAMFVYSLPKWAYHLATFMDGDLEFRHWIALTMKSTYPRGKKLYPAHYALLYFTKGPPRTFHHLRTPIPVCRHCGGDIRDYGGHRKALHPDGLSLTDFWDDTSPNRHRRTKARAGMNELKTTIPDRCIRIATEPGDLVLDPFGGGGSTYEAAQASGRFWMGSEIGDCGPARSRLEGAFPEAIRDDPPRRIRDLTE